MDVYSGPVGIHSISDKLAFIESVFGKGHLSGNSRNFDIRCPICAPSDPTKKKLSILTSDDRCHCWVCGFKARSLAPLIRKYGTVGQLARYREMFGGPDSGNTLVTGEKTEVARLTLPPDFQLLTLAPEGDPDVKATWRYVYSRGLDDRDAWYFKFGVSNEPRWKRRVIMPSFDSRGELNYFTARAIDKDKKPKYDNPEVDKNPIVFNDINLDWSHRMMLVEGPFDLVKCPQNTTALLGSDLDERHELFNKILLNNTPVWLALDGDMWHSKTPKIAKKLQEYDIDVLLVDVRPWGDPGSMSRSDIEVALRDSVRPTWESSILSRLQRASEYSLKI